MTDITCVVYVGLLYTYLADCAGKRGKEGAFRVLQRGFAHWSSGRLAKLEINLRHPQFCHVRCQCYERGLMNLRKPYVCHHIRYVKLNNQQEIKLKIFFGIPSDDTESLLRTLVLSIVGS